MTKFFNFKTILGLVLIIIALVPTKKIIDDVVLLNIDKPTNDIIEIVNPISNLITDPTDRAKLAIFNQAFATRAIQYETDTQQINDIYVIAGGNFFKDSMVDKYRDLDVMLVSLAEKAVGTENHKLTQIEKEKLSSYFMGLAWSLIQKR